MWGVLPPSLMVFLFVQVLCGGLDRLGASPFLRRSDCRLQSNRTFDYLLIAPDLLELSTTVLGARRVQDSSSNIFLQPDPKKYFPATQHTAQLKNPSSQVPGISKPEK